MKNNGFSLEGPDLIDKKIEKGGSFIRGKIVNFKDYIDESGHQRNTHVDVYFVDSFYVME